MSCDAIWAKTDNKVGIEFLGNILNFIGKGSDLTDKPAIAHVKNKKFVDFD